MLTLERLIAEHVLGALVQRQHFRVAHASHDSLRDELEFALVPLMPSVTPYLMAAQATADDADGGFGDRNAAEALAVMVDSLGERLSNSNHIDDIFVDDATIRRDSLRAARQVLLRYMRGEFEIADDASDKSRFVIALDSLGYLVASSAARLTEPLLTLTLSDAGTAAGAVLERFDAATRIATFSPATERTSLLAIEESVTGRVAALVASGQVALPCVEQVFELPATRFARGALSTALREAAMTLERNGQCRATCEKTASRRIRLAVTPLTEEAAQRVDAYFEELVALVEGALDALTSTPPSPAPESEAAISQTRRRGATGEARATTPKPRVKKVH